MPEASSGPSTPLRRKALRKTPRRFVWSVRGLLVSLARPIGGRGISEKGAARGGALGGRIARRSLTVCGGGGRESLAENRGGGGEGDASPLASMKEDKERRGRLLGVIISVVAMPGLISLWGAAAPKGSAFTVFGLPICRWSFRSVLRVAAGFIRLMLGRRRREASGRTEKVNTASQAATEVTHRPAILACSRGALKGLRCRTAGRAPGRGTSRSA